MRITRMGVQLKSSNYSQKLQQQVLVLEEDSKYSQSLQLNRLISISTVPSIYTNHFAPSILANGLQQCRWKKMHSPHDSNLLQNDANNLPS